MERSITVGLERYEQLIRAEQDANQLKSLIADAYGNFDTIDRANLVLLHKIYFGSKEGSKE